MVNIFEITNNLSEEKVWSAAHKIKFGTSVEKKCRDAKYAHHEALYRDEDKLLQVKALEQQLEIDSSELRLKNVKDKNLGSAAKIFMYLTTCTGKMKPWFEFYIDLFETKSASEIILTLSRLMKVTTTKKNSLFKHLAQKLFNRFANKFSLKYEEIASMLLEGGRNTSSSLSMIGGHDESFQLNENGMCIPCN